VSVCVCVRESVRERERERAREREFVVREREFHVQYVLFKRDCLSLVLREATLVLFKGDYLLLL
jgi:hypothetical protein